VSGQPVDLVFEGGGVKGIGLAGAFFELYQQGYRPACVAGTSAGAITAALVAAGYSGAELEALVLGDMHFALFADRPRLELLGPAGAVIDILKDRGLHSGKYFLDWIRQRLEAKGLTTFGQLRDGAAKGTPREYRLRVIASDLTDHGMLVLPQDAVKLGIEPDQLSVAEAVRMSMSIPIFFDPVIHANARDGRKHMIVDGGMLSNYPIWLFDAPEDAQPRFPTFGMLLVAPHQEDPLLPHPPVAASTRHGMPSLIGYVKAIADTMMQAHDRLHVEQANYARTIPIPTGAVTTTQFDISPAQARGLFQAGRTAAEQFLASWDFDAYIEKFRRGRPPGRREGILS
jgi:NTE family protein